MRRTTPVVLLLATAALSMPVLAESWRLDIADGSTIDGGLIRLTGDAATVGADGEERTIPTRELRAIARAPADRQPNPRREGRAVRVTLVDGSWLEADDVVVSGKEATVVRDGAKATLPSASIEIVECRARGGSGEPPAWLGAVGDGVSDVVAVGKVESPEIVECTIESVSAEAVAVVLDEERLPVKRAKVLGLKWHRPKPGPSGGLASVGIELARGMLRGDTITIGDGRATVTPASGDAIDLPAEWIDRIDFAEGRRLRLVTAEPERLEFEPWFGLFRSIDALADHFKPRRVMATAADGRSREALRIRPRTVISWRLPADAKRLSLTLAPGDPTRRSQAAEVAIAVDEREIHRSAAIDPVPIAASIEGARRLTITVEYPKPASAPRGTWGGEVLVVDPVVER